MSWQVRFEEAVFNRHPGAGQWYARVRRQPGWVTRTAFIIAVMVVVLPLLALTLAAVVVGLACLLVLGMVAYVGKAVTDLFNGGPRRKRDGRRNVRVMDRP